MFSFCSFSDLAKASRAQFQEGAKTFEIKQQRFALAA